MINNAGLPSSVELYDVVADPGESKNLAKKYPQKVEELKALLNSYAKEAKAPLYFREYLPFIVQDYSTSSTTEYVGDEDSGQPGEKPVLPTN